MQLAVLTSATQPLTATLSFRMELTSSPPTTASCVVAAPAPGSECLLLKLKQSYSLNQLF
jgi:hypothetical protein